MEEIFDIIDTQGNPTGETVTREKAHAEGIPHRTAHIWIIREKYGRTEVLLQKRSMNKDSFPGKFDTSSAGHIQAGDEPLESALRELGEELGIQATPEQLVFAGTFPISFAKEFHGKMFRDEELAFVYIYDQPVDIADLVLQKEEVEAVEWFALEETYEFLENVAFATVGDVMDLTDENRILVKEGLNRIHRTKNPGMRALIFQNHLEPEQINAYHFGFVLGPCINASGRLDTAKLSLSLFLQGEEEAAKTARELVELNQQRKDMTADGVEEAKRVVEEHYMSDKVLVIYLPQVHESLAGIIAGRIREAYHKPVFVLTKAEEGVKGSGRSIEEYSMYEELCKCRELLEKFGGHPMAAGLSLPEENVDKFREKINACANLTEDDLIPKIKIDIPVPAAYADAGLIREFAVLEPFGKANIKPQFADKNLSITKAFVVGKNQNVLRLNLLTAAGEAVSAVYFGDIEAFKAYYAEKYGSAEVEKAFRGQINKLRIMIVYYPEINEYNGVESVQVIIRNYQ